MKKTIRVLAAVLVMVMLSATVYADKFIPSAEQTGTLEIVPVQNEKGENADAVITDSSSKVVKSVPTGNLEITPLADAQKEGSQVSPEIKKNLNNAYDQIQKSKTLADLAPEIKNALKDTGIKVEDLVVRDLVDISLSEEYAETLKQEGNKITITFKLGLKPDEMLLVLHNYEADKWEMIPADRVVILKDGSARVTFDSLSPVAFVVGTAAPVEETEAPTVAPTEAPTEAPTQAVTEETVTEPAPAEDDNGSAIGWIIGIAAVVIVVIVVAVITSKNKNKKKEKVRN